MRVQTIIRRYDRTPKSKRRNILLKEHWLRWYCHLSSYWWGVSVLRCYSSSFTMDAGRGGLYKIVSVRFYSLYIEIIRLPSCCVGFKIVICPSLSTYIYSFSSSPSSDTSFTSYNSCYLYSVADYSYISETQTW